MTNELQQLEEQYEPASVLDTETFIQPPMPNVEDYDLTVIQLKAAQAVLLNDMTLKKRGNRRKPYKQLASELGIDEDTLIRYRALPEFQRFIKDAAQLSVASSVPMAIARLHQLADGSIAGQPSIKAIQMLLEMAGLYSTSTKVNVQVEQPTYPAQVSDADLQRIIAQHGDVIDVEATDTDDAK